MIISRPNWPVWLKSGQTRLTRYPGSAGFQLIVCLETSGVSQQFGFWPLANVVSVG